MLKYKICRNKTKQKNLIQHLKMLKCFIKSKPKNFYLSWTLFKFDKKQSVTVRNIKGYKNIKHYNSLHSETGHKTGPDRTDLDGSRFRTVSDFSSSFIFKAVHLERFWFCWVHLKFGSNWVGSNDPKYHPESKHWVHVKTHPDKNIPSEPNPENRPVSSAEYLWK